MLNFLTSSVDPSKLGATITGLLIGASALIISIAGHYGIVLGSEQVNILATQIGYAVSAIMTIFGLLRKATVKVSGLNR